MAQDIYDNNALHYAVQHGHLDIVKFFIEELECPPDIIGQQNTTPLQMARHENHLVIVQYLQKRSVIPYIYSALFVMKRLGFLK